ncbi:MAG: PHB depolymerase family esterase [Verrucomicrobiota bacterium]
MRKELAGASVVLAGWLAGTGVLPLEAGEARLAPGRERLREKITGNAGEKRAPGAARSLEHAGVKRTYRLHTPKGAPPAKPLPLVIVLHGMGANGALTEALTKFSPLADQEGFAVVYPDGLNKRWRYWGDEDTGFIVALVDELIRQGVADRARVHVCGISNGAYLTNVLASEHADRFAAVAAVAGTMPRRKASAARPSRPVPMLYIHGTADEIAGYDGRDRFSKRELSLAAEDLVHWWVKQNGCNPTPVREKLPDNADDGTTVERFRYQAPGGGADVVFFKINGGGHTWPGGSVQPAELLGKTCRDFDAAEVMWTFFARHRARGN